MKRRSTLYISYDGMMEPLGQSQVLAYLERLSDEYAPHIISFEKPADLKQHARRHALDARLSKAGITWHPLIWHKTPTVPATLYDITRGILLGIWLVARHNIGLIHARSYVPALIGWVIKLFTGAKLIFDMRGFWADERTDGGLWPVGGRLYLMVKKLERLFLLGSDHIVTLTHASRGLLASLAGVPENQLPPISIIPTCADLDRFTPDKASKPNIFTLGYLGSIGTWYRFDLVLALFTLIRARRPDAKLLVVNRNEQAHIRTMLAENNIDPAAVEITSADHAEVPAMIRRMSVGAAIIEPCFSKISSAPTKLAEYLGCGVPCLGNVGVGDMQAILEDEGAGVALHDFSEAARIAAVDRLLILCDKKDIATHCREVALRHFHVKDGVVAYRTIYRTLLA